MGVELDTCYTKCLIKKGMQQESITRSSSSLTSTCICFLVLIAELQTENKFETRFIICLPILPFNPSSVFCISVDCMPAIAAS